MLKVTKFTRKRLKVAFLASLSAILGMCDALNKKDIYTRKRYFQRKSSFKKLILFIKSHTLKKLKNLEKNSTFWLAWRHKHVRRKTTTLLTCVEFFFYVESSIIYRLLHVYFRHKVRDISIFETCLWLKNIFYRDRHWSVDVWMYGCGSQGKRWSSLIFESLELRLLYIKCVHRRNIYTVYIL